MIYGYLVFILVITVDPPSNLLLETLCGVMLNLLWHLISVQEQEDYIEWHYQVM